MTRPNRESLKEAVVIFGAGGHGSVVLDTAVAAGFSVKRFVDEHPKSPELYGVPFVDAIDFAPFHFIVAIGENASRARIATVRAVGASAAVTNAALMASTAMVEMMRFIPFGSDTPKLASAFRRIVKSYRQCLGACPEVGHWPLTNAVRPTHSSAA